MYPDDCIQSIVDPGDWWIQNTENKICKGSLIHSFIPHFDQVPYTFEMKGRTQATEHDKADIVISPLKVDQPLKQINLPVAAIPLYKGEVWGAYKAKRRPCLVIKDPLLNIDHALTKGMPKSSSAPTILVAPYYGADRDGTRAGYNQVFVERIKHCHYPQFVWDKLPIDGATEVSILRLDQLQPIGAHHHSYRLSSFKLSDSAFAIIEDLIKWVIFGGLPEKSDVLAFRQLMQEPYNG